MAFKGLHVACGFIGPAYRRDLAQSIIGKVVWSEQPAEGAPSTNVAPSDNGAFGMPMFRITAEVDSFVSIGIVDPDPAVAALLVQAGHSVDIYAEPGSRLAWMAA